MVYLDYTTYNNNGEEILTQCNTLRYDRSQSFYSFVSSNGFLPFVYTSSGACPHSYFVSMLIYFHLFRCSLLHIIPVHNLLRHLHAVQGLVCLLARLSSKLTAQLWDVKFFRRCHSLQRMTFAGKSAGRKELRKHSLFKRLCAGILPGREWAAFVSCFFFSTLAHTSLF